MIKLVSLFIFLVFAIPLQAKKITVGTGGNFETLEAVVSILKPGDTVVVLSQTFFESEQFIRNLNGSDELPIVFMAENEHKSIFNGGAQSIHLSNCNFLEINGFVFEEQTANGVNIDDGGDYNSPSTNIIVRNCVFRNMAEAGNHDFLKMSGVDYFLVENCRFSAGTEGSGIDLVGCHNGVIQDCEFDNAGSSGIQCKGGTQYITFQRNIIRNISNRGINLGGSTGKTYFRPPLTEPILNAFEAADLKVFSNIFIGCLAPVAYVGCVRVKVINNTFVNPGKWVIRILQETTDEGFVKCSDNEFSNNIVYLKNDLTEVNIGGNTSPETFTFTNNLWFNEASTAWRPNLPLTDPNQLIANPLFKDLANEDFKLLPNSPAIGLGNSNLNPEFDFEKNKYSNPPSVGAFEGKYGTVGTYHFESPNNKSLLYPNPSDGTFWVDFGDEEMVREYTICDMQGKVILSESIIKQSKLKISFHSPAGIYILKVKSKIRKEVFQLIKG